MRLHIEQLQSSIDELRGRVHFEADAAAVTATRECVIMIANLAVSQRREEHECEPSNHESAARRIVVRKNTRPSSRPMARPSANSNTTVSRTQSAPTLSCAGASVSRPSSGQ